MRAPLFPLSLTKGNTLTEATSASLGPDNTTAQAVANQAPPKEQSFKDELQKVQFEALDNVIKQKNDLVGRANAANGDRQSLTEQIRDNSTDPQIVSLREQISELILQLDSLVTPLVDATIAENSGDVNAIEEQIKALDKTVKSGRTYYKSVYGDEAAEFLTKEERLKGARLGSGAGTRRIRGYNLTVTIDGDDTTFENFSSAAKYIGVDTPDLQRAFMDKAGTEDADKFPAEVKFVVEFTDVDDDENKTEKSAMVRAYKTEEKAASNDAAEDTPEDSNVDEAPAESTDEVNLDEF